MSDLDVPAVEPQIAEAPPPSDAASPAAAPIDYGTLLEQGTPGQVSYGDLLEPSMGPTPVVDLQKEREQRLRATLLGAQKTKVEEAAKVVDLSRKTGLPAALVERNMQKVDGEQKISDYAGLLDKSPMLSQWLLEDEMNAKVAQKDFRDLSWLEHTVNNLFWSNYYSNRADANQKGMNQAQLLISDLEAAIVRRDAGEPLSAYDQGLLKDEADIRDTARQAIIDYGMEKYRRQQQGAELPKRPNVIEMEKASKEQDFGKWFDAFMKDPWGAFWDMSIQSVYNLPAQLAAGAVAGPVGVFTASFYMEYWGAVNDALEAHNVDINDPTQLMKAFADPELMAKVKEQASIKASTIGTFDALSFGLASKFLGFGKKAVTRVATNIPAQFLVQGAAGGAGEAAGSYLAGLPIDIHSVAAEVMGEAIGSPVEVATARWRDAHRADMTAKEWGRISELPPLERQAAIEAFSMDRLIEIAGNTQIGKNSPEKLQEFIQTLVKDGGGTVFVPAEAVMTFMQDMTGLQAEQFAASLGITEQLGRIAATNEDVAIPLEKYVTGASEAHKAWREQIRTEVDGFSIKQAQEFEKAKAAELKELQDRFEEQIQAGIVADPQTIVYQQVLAMAKANGYTNEVAAQHAALYASRYAARAARNPERYADALDAFQQAGPGTGMTIQTVLPDGTRAMGPDVFDTMLDSIRSGKDPIVPPAHFAHLEARKEAQKAALEPVLGPEPAPDAPAPPTPKQVAEARNKAAMEAFKAQRQEVADALASMGLDPATMTNQQIRDAVARKVEGTTFQQATLAALREKYGFHQDNPATRGNTAWLKEKQEDAEAGYAQRNGIQGATTAWIEKPVLLPLSMVASLPGARNEKRGPGEGQYEALMESVRENGWQQEESPILIEINHRGEAFITEGNTRARVAADLGKQAIWAEIKWLNGGEQVDGEWAPDTVLSQIDQSTFQQEARGEITFSDNVTTISLFQARDLSTLAHETGHLWLAELEFDAKSAAAFDQIKGDWQTVLTFLGSDGYITREQHELFARAFETYLMEGKAPTEGLRGVFRSFKNWLVSIYRNLARLQAPISPEMREVFDRLIATDEEIASARDVQGFNPVFTDAKSAGMTEAEFAAYTKRVTQVVDAAEEAVLAKVMATIRRQKTKEVAAEKSKIRKEVTEEMMKDPGNAALHLLRTGMLYGSPVTPMSLVDAKLSRAALVAIVGEEGLQRLPRGIYASEGLDPNDLAQVFGLGNGQELVERLMQIQAETDAMRAKGDNRSPLNARIAEETQRRLTESLGDPLNDGSIEAEAMAAIHSDKQGALLSSELKVLARKAGHSGTITLDDLKAWASNTIGEMSVYQATQASKYQRAERMAGQAVQRALIKGDFVAAFKAKQDQLVNFALYTEAKKAAQEAESIRKLADRYASAATIKSMDQGALEQIHQLLEQYDFKRRSGALLAERTTFSAWAAEQAAQGFEVIEPPRLKGADRVHFSQMTMDEIRGLGDTIKQIAHIGRWKQEMVDGAKKRAFEEIVAEAVDTAGKIDQRGVSQMRRGTTSLQDMLGSFASQLRSIDAALLKMETIFEWLDNDKTGRGVFSRVVFRRIADAQVKERDLQKDLAGKMQAIYDKVPAEQRKAWSTQHTIPELGVKLNQSQIIAVALNMGNDSNMQKMLSGEKWDEAAVRQMLDKHLSKEEWQFVQDTWDLIETLWPETEALEKRVNGVAPPKVEATPVQTPHGTLRGGYYPMAYDKAGDIKADRIASKSAEGLFDPEYRRASTRAGSTNKRTEGFNAKVLLSLNVIGSHLNEVAHDLAFREAVMDSFKFLSDDRVREAIRSAVGPEYEKQTQVWLKAVANEWAVDRRGLEGIDKFLQTARANTAVVGMGFRVSTMFSQVAGFANSIQRLGSASMMAGIRDFYKDPAGMAAFVRERSGEMRHRANDLERDIRLALKRMEGKDGNLDAVRRFAFRGIALFDAAVSLPTWMGAYSQGLKDGMTEAEAIAYGDKMVRDTQGAGSVKDLSAFQRGGEALKLLGMFYSYFNVYYNRQRGIVRDARAADSFSDYMDVVGQGMWLMVVPTLLSALLSGQGPEDDEEWWLWATRNVGFGVFSGIPWARDIGGSLSNQIAGKGFGGAKLSPVQGIGEGIQHLFTDAAHLVKGEETSKSSIKNLFNVVGLFTALPTGQLGATTQFVWDALADGSQNPEGLLDWLKGLAYGPKKQK